MKNHYWRADIVFCCLLFFGVIIGVITNASSDSEKVEDEKSVVPYCVSALDVPQSVTFAGETIDLSRYDMRERMDREMMSFTYMHSTTILTIKKANRFFPIIEPLLKQNDIPDDFKYLMVIESSLNTCARSAAGAAGLWQLMPETGRQYGLEVNSNIDERYHIEKSTRAACKYLKEAYGKFGDWLSVAASYNTGQARISGEYSKQLVNRAADLWLVEETSRYMFRLLAAKEVLQRPLRYGFVIKKSQLYPPIECNEVKVEVPIPNLAEFAQENGVSYAQLKDFNPWLQSRNLENKSGRTYILKIPVKESMFYDPEKTKPYYEAWVVD